VGGCGCGREMVKQVHKAAKRPFLVILEKRPFAHLACIHPSATSLPIDAPVNAKFQSIAIGIRTR